MKDDVIYRQAAIDALDRIFDKCEEIEAHLPKGDPDRTGYKMYPDYMTVWKYLHQLPSAEPEIVRCKDCKYYNPTGVCIEMSSAVCEDSFCCWAERRTDG